MAAYNPDYRSLIYLYLKFIFGTCYTSHVPSDLQWNSFSLKKKKSLISQKVNFKNEWLNMLCFF